MEWETHPTAGQPPSHHEGTLRYTLLLWGSTRRWYTVVDGANGLSVWPLPDDDLCWHHFPQPTWRPHFSTIPTAMAELSPNGVCLRDIPAWVRHVAHGRFHVGGTFGKTMVARDQQDQWKSHMALPQWGLESCAISSWATPCSYSHSQQSWYRRHLTESGYWNTRHHGIWRNTPAFGEWRHFNIYCDWRTFGRLTYTKACLERYRRNLRDLLSVDTSRLMHTWTSSA